MTIFDFRLREASCFPEAIHKQRKRGQKGGQEIVKHPTTGAATKRTRVSKRLEIALQLQAAGEHQILKSFLV